MLLMMISCSKESVNSSNPSEPVILYNFTISSSSGGTTDMTGGSVASGTSLVVTAIPDEGYEFSGWSDGNMDNPRTFIINSGFSVTANFALITYNLTILIEGEGKVDKEILREGPSQEYVPESLIRLHALPSSGWYFKEWMGAISSEENPVDLQISDETSITAVFKENPNAYLDGNGITIKVDESVEAGTYANYNGEDYLVVDTEMLRQMVEGNANLSRVITTKVVDMGQLFRNESDVLSDISSWDVSNVTNMSYMFHTTDFNQDISSWDVSNVTNMDQMFFGTNFNQPIGNWNVGKVTSMYAMFGIANDFNQDISNWDVSNVQNMGGLFGVYEGDTYAMNEETHLFNQDISNWDVSSVTNMDYMFGFAIYFNQDLSNWDVSNVTDMSGMFVHALNFNSDISSWDVSNVTNMNGMFNGTRAFNQPIGGWDVSNVTNMNEMFHSFNWIGPEDDPNYYRSKFNQDISSWDVSKVESMFAMFRHNIFFNQDLSGWNVENVTVCGNFAWDTNWALPRPNFTNCDPY